MFFVFSLQSCTQVKNRGLASSVNIPWSGEQLEAKISKKVFTNSELSQIGGALESQFLAFSDPLFSVSDVYPKSAHLSVNTTGSLSLCALAYKALMHFHRDQDEAFLFKVIRLNKEGDALGHALESDLIIELKLSDLKLKETKSDWSKYFEFCQKEFELSDSKMWNFPYSELLSKLQL